MLGRSYPPSNVRSAAWYLACVALMFVPVFFLVLSTASQDPSAAVAAAPAIGRAVGAAIGLFVAAVLLGVGFRFMYPLVLLVLVIEVVRAVGSDPSPLEILVPIPALLLLITPSAVAWFLGMKRKVLPVVVERDFRLPQR